MLNNVERKFPKRLIANASSVHPLLTLYKEIDWTIDNHKYIIYIYDNIGVEELNVNWQY